LCPRDPGERRQRGSAPGQLQEFTTRKFHGLLPASSRHARPDAHFVNEDAEHQCPLSTKCTIPRKLLPPHPLTWEAADSRWAQAGCSPKVGVLHGGYCLPNRTHW
jgi:hypothetical protein